jgi:hypothetical protein
MVGLNADENTPLIYVFATEKVGAKMAAFEIEKKTYKPYCGLRDALDRQM